jgi:hypothetical protein
LGFQPARAVVEKMKAAKDETRMMRDWKEAWRFKIITESKADENAN